MDDIKAERDGLMSEKEASRRSSSQEEELQSRLTSLQEEKEEMSEMLEMVKREEQQLRAELNNKLVALQTEVSSSVGLQPDVQTPKSDAKINMHSFHPSFSTILGLGHLYILPTGGSAGCISANCDRGEETAGKGSAAE